MTILQKHPFSSQHGAPEDLLNSDSLASAQRQHLQHVFTLIQVFYQTLQLGRWVNS